MMTTKTEPRVDDAPTTTSEQAPKVAGRVTVNLSKRTVEALDATSALTDDTKTEVINKAVQLYQEVQEAQGNGGGIWIKPSKDAEPILVRYR